MVETRPPLGKRSTIVEKLLSRQNATAVGWGWLQIAIHLATVRDDDDCYRQLGIINAVDNSIIASPHAIEVSVP